MRIANTEVRAKLAQLVAELIDGDYEQMEREGSLRPHTAEGTRERIASYPGTITMPPESAFEEVRDLWETDACDDDLRTFRIVMDLWFSGQASDLVLEARWSEKRDGTVAVTVHGIL